MLIATITALLIVFGGGASATLTVLDFLRIGGEVIEDRVEDEAQRAEMLAVVERMESDTIRFAEEMRDHRKELLVLDRIPDSTREQYLDVFRRLDAKWDDVEESLVGGVLELRGMFAYDEWLKFREEAVGDVE